MKARIFATGLALASSIAARAELVNADFSRDTTAQNPGGNAAAILYAGSGPLLDTGTVWNDLQVPLAASGDEGTDSVAHPVSFVDLVSSTGAATTIDIELTSGFFRSFNSYTSTVPTSDAVLQGDRVFSRNGSVATLTISGLDSGKAYDLCLITAAFATNFSIGGTTLLADGTNSADGTFVEGQDYVVFPNVTPTGGGEIVVSIQDGLAPITSFGVLAGLQIKESLPTRFLYADDVTTTGGQFNASYPPTNLVNNGFTSPMDTISTTGDYIAAGNNYASAAGTTSGFDLTFNFDEAVELDGMHIWNYIFRSGGNGSTSGASGVNACTLTFFDGPDGTGSQIGAPFAATLAAVSWNGINPAQTVDFANTYSGVRSVVFGVDSNHGGTNFTGMCELAFNGEAESSTTESITSFTASTPFVQRPALPTLSGRSPAPSPLSRSPPVSATSSRSPREASGAWRSPRSATRPTPSPSTEPSQRRFPSSACPLATSSISICSPASRTCRARGRPTTNCSTPRTPGCSSSAAGTGWSKPSSPAATASPAWRRAPA